jgi:hypothetical protein
MRSDGSGSKTCPMVGIVLVLAVLILSKLDERKKIIISFVLYRMPSVSAGVLIKTI